MQKPTSLITHDGEFHLDEMFSSIVLREIYPEANLVRTRNREIIDQSSGQSIIFDVGMSYIPEEGRFDHHQPEPPKRLDGGTYSSFGLVWKHYGKTYLDKCFVQADWIEDIWAKIDSTIVRAIDMADNGELPSPEPGSPEHILQSTTLHAVIRALYPSENGSWDGAFESASKICTQFLKGTIHHHCNDMRKAKLVEQAIEAQWGSPVLILQEGSSYDEIIQRRGADHVRFITHPRGKEWLIRAAPVAPGRFDFKHYMPESWAGLEYEDLDRETGHPGGVFCHRGRWIAAHSTREGALAMIEQALKGQGASVAA